MVGVLIFTVLTAFVCADAAVEIVTIDNKEKRNRFIKGYLIRI